MSLKERFIFNFIEDNRWKYLWEGLGATLKVTFFALLLGVAIGIVIAIIRLDILPKRRAKKTAARSEIQAPKN